MNSSQSRGPRGFCIFNCIVAVAFTMESFETQCLSGNSELQNLLLTTSEVLFPLIPGNSKTPQKTITGSFIFTRKLALLVKSLPRVRVILHIKGVAEIVILVIISNLRSV